MELNRFKKNTLILFHCKICAGLNLIRSISMAHGNLKLVELGALLREKLLAYAASISNSRLTVHYCKINLYPCLSPPCASLLFLFKSRVEKHTKLQSAIPPWRQSGGKQTGRNVMEIFF